MKRTLYVTFLFILITLRSLAQTNDAAQEIMQVLNQQAISWNEGNLEKYMEGYWKSDSLQFIGKNGITKGWDATLNRYKKSYPDKVTMGVLSFDIISNEELNDKYYFVVGTWHLKREKDELKGYFSLIWKKIDGKWLIISDHSS
jgi:hypothetical protein